MVIGRNNQSGFTLMEVLIVVVLMAIIAGISTPYMIGMQRNSEMRDAARTVANMIQEVRSLAVRDGAAHQLECDPSTQSCEIQSVAYNAVTTNWEPTTIRSYSFPANVLMRTGDACNKSANTDSLSIEYFPNGNAEVRSAMSEPSVCVNLSAADPRFRIRLVSTTSGKVVVERP